MALVAAGTGRATSFADAPAAPQGQSRGNIPPPPGNRFRALLATSAVLGYSRLRTIPCVRPGFAFMSAAISSNVTAFVQALCQSGLLDRPRMAKLTKQLQFRFGDAPALGQDLVRRGWLTPPQVTQLLTSVGATAPPESSYAAQKAKARHRWLMFNIVGGIFLLAVGAVVFYVVRYDRLSARDHAEKLRIQALEAQAQGDLKPLQEGFDKFTLDDAALRKQLHAFRGKYSEAPAALKAAALIARLPSPLDNLRGIIPPAEKEPNQPANLVAVLGTRRWKHWSPIRTLAATASGSLVATATDDGVVRLWERGSGNEAAVFATGPAVALMFLPGDKMLACHASDGNVSLWNIEQKKKHGDYPGPVSKVVTAAFTPDGLVAASAQEDGLVKVWELESGKERGLLRGHRGLVNAVAFSPDTQTVATAGQDGSVILWGQTGNARMQLAEHTDAVHSLAYSADGQYLATGGGPNDRNVIVWDAARGESLQVCQGHEAAVQTVAFGNESKQLITGSADQALRLWELRLTRPMPVMPAPDPNNPDAPPPPTPPPAPLPPPVSFKLTGHTGPVARLAVFGAGPAQTIVSGGSDGTLRLWNVARRTQTTEIEGHQGPVAAVTFIDDGELIASGSHDRTVRVWSTQTGATRLQLIGHTAPVTAVSYAPSTRLLASASFDTTVRLWTPNGTAEQGTLAHHPGPLLTAALAFDGKTLAAGGTPTHGDGGVLRLWNPANQKERFDLTGQTQMIAALAFAPSGQTLAAGSYDGSVRLYEPWTGISRGAVQEQTPIESVAVSPDGKHFAAGTHARAIKVWSAADFTVETTHANLPAIARGLAYSPDGQWLAAGLQDGKVLVWNTATEEKHDWQMPGPIHGIAFAPDSRHLATANANGTVYILRLAEAPVKRGVMAERSN